MSGLLCLKWNNHSTAFYKTLNNHRTKELYCDTTIVCRGKYYPVHRLVLTTCSEYFEEIYERTQCKHPFIIIKDIQPAELEALLNYMYKGEVNVLQDMLPGLIKAAESLKIRGLAVPDDGESGDETKARKRCHTSSPSPNVKKSRKIIKKSNRPNDCRRSVSPSSGIEVEPEIISIEPQTSITEESSEAVSNANTSKFNSNKKQVSSLYDQNSLNLNYKKDESSQVKSKSKGNSEELKDDDENDDDDNNIELEDVKVEVLEMLPLEDMDENNYPLSESEVDSKTETEGSLFRTLLGGDDTASNKKKLKNSNNNENHPMAQCSSWDDNLEHSNDDSHLNSDDMQDEISGTRLDMDAFRAHLKQSIWNLSSSRESTTENSSSLESYLSGNHLYSNKSENNDSFTPKTIMDKIYQCPVCAFRSVYVSSVKRHVKNQHFSCKPYHCETCQYKTSRKDNLDTHKIRVHSSLPSPSNSLTLPNNDANRSVHQEHITSPQDILLATFQSTQNYYNSP